MEFETLLLARLQFAFTISFHILFPAFSIGLASYLAVLNGLSLLTGEQVFQNLFDYWKKIFAIAFGMGVVSGIVMSYQFGTNWSVFADKVGPVLGPLMGYEVLTAFFLEAGFLGVMLFGRDKVGHQLHFFATLMVAFGTFLSAFWILSVNSWMQTPAGYAINEAGQFTVTDWLAVIFNPSFPYRLAHMLLAAYLTTAFIVAATGAYHLHKRRHDAHAPAQAARTMFSMAMWMITVTAPLQILAGDLHGLNTLQYQPAKIAAMEGHYETRAGAPLILFGIPDPANARIRYQLAIPALGSLILTHDAKGVIRGLNEWPQNQRPPVQIVFWSFRIMVGIGMAMLAIGIGSLILRYKKRLFSSPSLHRASMLMGPAGLIAVLAGWVTTECGRQPYTVYGLLTTAQSASAVNAAAISASLLAFIVVYFALFGSGTFYICRLMRKGPEPAEPGLPPDQPIRAAGITPLPAIPAPRSRTPE